MRQHLRTLLITLTLCLPVQLYAAAGFSQEKIWIAKDPVFVGEKVDISTALFNSSLVDFAGTIEFNDNTKTGDSLIGKREFKLKPGKAEIISVEWTPAEGEHSISARITEVGFGTSTPASTSSPAYLSGKILRVIVADTDRDGVGNDRDLDDDNDGLSDIDEKKQKTDPLLADTDGDGILDATDKMPLVRATTTEAIASVVTTRASTTLEQFAQNLPPLAGPLKSALVGAESIRTNEETRVTDALSDTITTLTSPPASSASGTPPVAHESPQSAGWHAMYEAIDDGELVRSPFAYTKLLFALIYQFILSHAWSFYIFFGFIIIWIARFLSSLIFGGFFSRSRF